MEPAVGEHRAAQGTETPTCSHRVSQRVLLGWGPAEGGALQARARGLLPVWEFPGKLLLHPGLTLLSLAGLLGGLRVHHRRGLHWGTPFSQSWKRGRRSQSGLGQQGFPDSAQDGAPRRAVSPPVLSTLLHKACSGVSVCVCTCVYTCVQLYTMPVSEPPTQYVCVHVCVRVCACVQLYTISSSESPPIICVHVCTCVCTCVYSSTPLAALSGPHSRRGPQLTGPAGARCCPAPQQHPPRAARPGPPRLSGPCRAQAERRSRHPQETGHPMPSPGPVCRGCCPGLAWSNRLPRGPRSPQAGSS